MHTSDPSTIADLQGVAESGDINLTESTEFGEVTYTIPTARSRRSTTSRPARPRLCVQLRRLQRHPLGKGILTRATGPFAPGNIGNLDDSGLPSFDLDKARSWWRSTRPRRPAAQLHVHHHLAASTIADAEFFAEQAAAAGMDVEIVTATSRPRSTPPSPATWPSAGATTPG
jgi:peptide/nickel transport system substrate-binding protein